MMFVCCLSSCKCSSIQSPQNFKRLHKWGINSWDKLNSVKPMYARCNRFEYIIILMHPKSRCNYPLLYCSSNYHLAWEYYWSNSCRLSKYLYPTRYLLVSWSQSSILCAARLLPSNSYLIQIHHRTIYFNNEGMTRNTSNAF